MAFFETLSNKAGHVFRQAINWLDNGAKIGAAVGAAIGIGAAIVTGVAPALIIAYSLIGILGGGFVGLNMGGLLGAAKGLITRSRPNGDQIMKDASKCDHPHQPQLAEQVHLPVSAPAVSSDNGLPIAPDTKVASAPAQPQSYVNALPPGQTWASRVKATPELAGAGRGR